MTPNIHPFCRHSGIFNPFFAILPVFASVIVGIPLGLIYAYLVKWIPFIYLNFFITLFYGLAFGGLNFFLFRIGKVRNTTVAVAVGFVTGFIGLYFAWNGDIHAMVAPSSWIFMSNQVWTHMKLLNDNGSWGMGFSSHENVTGVFLALVWLCEAAAIVGGCVMISRSAVVHTPFCEQHLCWLDKEKKMEALDSFVSAAHIQAFKAGDISPIQESVPRVPGAGRFSRFVIRHSPNREHFCTLTVSNVEVSIDKKGKRTEKTKTLMNNLQVPKSIFEYLAQFEHPLREAGTTGSSSPA